MSAVKANTPANESPDDASAVNTIPVVARASALPSESPMASAELLKPWLSVVDIASVMVLSRGYMSPIPPPPSTQPTMATAGGSVSSAVTNTDAIAANTRVLPTVVAKR